MKCSDSKALDVIATASRTMPSTRYSVPAFVSVNPAPAAAAFLIVVNSRASLNEDHGLLGLRVVRGGFPCVYTVGHTVSTTQACFGPEAGCLDDFDSNLCLGGTFVSGRNDVGCTVAVR